MTTYTIRFYGEDSKVETETVEAETFKTSTHANGPVTFFRNTSSYRSPGEKVAHYNRVISIRHEVLDMNNDPASLATDEANDGYEDDKAGFID